MRINIHFHLALQDKLFRTRTLVQAVDLSIDWCDRKASSDGLPMLCIGKRSNYHFLCYQENTD